MNLPTPDSYLNLKLLLPILGEMLAYCAAQAIENCGGRGDLDYKCDKDELIYHLKLDQLDRDLFDTLIGVEEIWVLTKGTRVDS